MIKGQVSQKPESVFFVGGWVEVDIQDANGHNCEKKIGRVSRIIPPRPEKLISTRYDIILDETGETLKEVNPVCMRMI